MDGSDARVSIRDPRYAPRNLTVERRDDGALILFNPTPIGQVRSTALEALQHWAMVKPGQLWLAERSGDGWRGVRIGEA